jgi:hypothetical protein
MSIVALAVGGDAKFAKLLAKVMGAFCYNLSCPECGAKMIRE